MKILNSFRFLRGRGSDKGSTPALVPPDQQSVLRSISIFESVDILCEGPIYGLVDQYGKKVYGLDMLKGIYLNKIPVMNARGEYNYRNVLMEINLGTENQSPLANFKNVYIFRPSSFKLLGPIRADSVPVDEVRPHPDGGPPRDFVAWARGPNGWPSAPQDPYIFVHHIKNKDVKKVKISMIIENLFDTVDRGPRKNESGKMGMSKSTSMHFNLTYGLEGTRYMITRAITINGTVNSPYALMLGEDRKYASSTTTKGRVYANPSDLPDTRISDTRAPTAGYSAEALNALNGVVGDTIPLSSVLFYFDPGNKACYPGSGSVCYDLVSSEQGTISGARYFGPNRPSFLFDGTDDRIRFNSSIFNKPYSGKTIIIAARLAAHLTNDSYKPMWSTDGSRNFGTWLYRNSNGQYSIHFATGGNSVNSAFLPIVLNQWFMIAVTQTSAGYTSFYFNGNSYGTGPMPFTQFIENTYEYLGYWNNQYWNGNFGSVLIYKESLSSTLLLQVTNIIKRKFSIS